MTRRELFAGLLAGSVTPAVVIKPTAVVEPDLIAHAVEKLLNALQTLPDTLARAQRDAMLLSQPSSFSHTHQPLTCMAHPHTHHVHTDACFRLR